MIDYTEIDKRLANTYEEKRAARIERLQRAAERKTGEANAAIGAPCPCSSSKRRPKSSRLRLP